MGKVAKVALPIAAAAAGAYFLGPAALGPAASSGAAASGAASGGFSLFSSSNLGLASAGLSALTSLAAGNQASVAAQYQQQQIEEQKRLARLQALNLEVDAQRRHRAVVAAAKAKAAASGYDVSKSRSFLAFLGEQQNLFEEEVANIRVNAISQGNQFDIQSRAAGAKAKASMLSGGLKAAGAVVSGARNFLDTRKP